MYSFSATKRLCRRLLRRIKHKPRHRNQIRTAHHVRRFPMEEKIRKDEKDWKKQLTQNQYYVTRQKGTEPPFTGQYADTEDPGTYKCVCCGQPLFTSETKFHSGSGWPSFYAPLEIQAR